MELVSALRAGAARVQGQQRGAALDCRLAFFLEQRITCIYLGVTVSTELTISFPGNYHYSHHKASTFTRKTEHPHRTSTLSLTDPA